MRNRIGDDDVTAAHAAPRELASVEYVVSLALFWGGVLGVVLVMVGMTLHLSDGSWTADPAMLGDIRSTRDDGLAAGTFVSVGEISQGLSKRPMDSLALVALGLGVLLLTPLAGVALALLAFVRIRDRRYIVISSLVLAILIASFFVAAT